MAVYADFVTTEGNFTIRRLVVEEPNREVAFSRDEICIHSHSKRIPPRRDTIFPCPSTRATLAQDTPSTVEGWPALPTPLTPSLLRWRPARVAIRLPYSGVMR